jgi:hypothetical protein
MLKINNEQKYLLIPFLRPCTAPRKQNNTALFLILQLELQIYFFTQLYLLQTTLGKGDGVTAVASTGIAVAL